MNVDVRVERKLDHATIVLSGPFDLPHSTEVVHAVQEAEPHLDGCHALFGMRYWHLGTTVTLQPTQIGNGFYGSSNWVDAVAGGRFQAFLTPKFVLTISGDAGGGGSGTKLDYQVREQLPLHGAGMGWRNQPVMLSRQIALSLPLSCELVAMLKRKFQTSGPIQHEEFQAGVD